MYFQAQDRPQRHLVRNSFIVELVEGHRKLRHLFLFNDVIVCAKYKVSGPVSMRVLSKNAYRFYNSLSL